ncbi:lytic transglycosylase domain-containing protein [Compostibacter hankyongensis]|uniref:Transglycosylase SLT domain-containing protein n=1 Tax=Compostibacter hankyongensis TaxID=1007089 RepID=A0ABP8FZ36_9BACT
MQKTCTGVLVALLISHAAWAQTSSPKQVSLKNAVTDSVAVAATGSPADEDTIAMTPVQEPESGSLSETGDEPVPSLTTTPLATAAPSDSLMGPDVVVGNLNGDMVSYINSYYKHNTGHFRLVREKGESYFTLIERVFRDYGIPEDLKYLAVIESGLNTRVVSRAGAVGPWQLMAGTARVLGLTVNRRHDERRDLYKSTLAAAKYLNQLYDMLHDWVLVVAAYNCGPGGVQKAINASGSDDFWQLKNFLPHESSNHVMKFLATAYIMDRFANFFGMDQQELAGMLSPVSGGLHYRTYTNLQSLNISGKYSMAVIAKYLNMDIGELNHLNPDFGETASAKPGGQQGFDLKLPADKMMLFKQNRGTILNESVQLLMENNQRQLSSNDAEDEGDYAPQAG